MKDNDKRIVCIVTGSRAEYGLLKPLVRELEHDDRVNTQLVVTGAHLEASFGNTLREIESDGIDVAATVDMHLDDDSALGRARSLALATRGLAQVFAELGPDLVTLLGDRYEVLAAAQAAMLLNIPIAHLHGGERTDGLIDDAIRHAVTKMSHLHFVSAEPHRRRVIQLGEHPDRVFDVGAFGLDEATTVESLSRMELAARVGLRLDRPFVLATFHPVTLEPAQLEQALEEWVAGLELVPEFDVILTKANADPGGDRINARLSEFASSHPSRVALVANLGTRAYISALRMAAAVVGNSSSGLIEAPAVGTPTVNVGARQRGRLRPATVLEARDDRTEIARAIRVAATDEQRARVRDAKSPYGRGGAAKRTAAIIAEHPLGGIVEKGFYDIDLSG